MRAETNPFPGLRPFETRDRLLFFGRERPTAELMRRLRATRFVAVVGGSGSGKSSLVRAGLLPDLHGGFMAGAGSNWTIAVMRPGGDPVGNLAAALAATGEFGSTGDSTTFARTTLARSARGLVECVQQAGLPASRNLLIVVDQFEEVFRYRNRSRTLEEESGDFVRLLLEATRQTERPIYVVLTMRSDYLGDCAEFTGLAEAIDDGQFLVPRMKREELRLAIEGPIRVAGGQIAARLVQRLINDVGTDRDQLPVLQHALMRMWDLWASESPRTHPLDLRHYEAVGTLSEALSRHLDEVYFSLSGDSERTLAEALFKALTELGPDNRGIRRPTRLGDLCRILAAESADLTRVIDPFRQPGRTFLMPPTLASGSRSSEEDAVSEEAVTPAEGGQASFGATQTLLEPGTVIDISHESLMRVWGRLKGWVEAEAASAGIYKRLAESALLCEQGRSGVYRDPELQIALNWRDQSRPTAAWAERYAPGYERSMEFLDRSVAEREAVQRAIRFRRRAVVGSTSAAALVFLVLALVALTQKHKADSRLLAIRAEDQIGRDPRRSVLLALEAWKASHTPEALVALRRTALASRLQKDNWMPLPAEANPDHAEDHGLGLTALSPEGTTLLAAAHTKAYLLSTNSTHSTVLSAQTNLVRVAIFSHNGAYALTAGGDDYAILWDAKTWGRLATLTGHTNPISRAVFSVDDRIVATASRDGIARIYELPSGRLLSQAPSAPRGGVKRGSIAFNPEADQVALGAANGRVEIWRWSDTNLIQTLEIHEGRSETTNDVVDIVFAMDRTNRLLAVVRERGSVELWHSVSNRWSWRTNLPCAQDPINAMAMSPDDHWLAVGGQKGTKEGSTVLFEIETGLPVLTNAEPASVVSVSFSRDSRSIVTASDDGKGLGRVRRWDTGVRKLPRWGSPTGVNWVEFAPDEQFFIAADESTNLWVSRTDDGARSFNFTGHSNRVVAGVVLADARRLITAGEDNFLRVWDMGRWSNMANQSITQAPNSMARSSKGDLLIVTHSVRSMVWRSQPLEPRQILEHPADVENGADVLHASFSRDDQRLVTASRAGAVVWTQRRGNWMPIKAPIRGNLHWAEFAPEDPLRLVTAGDTVRFYRYASGQWREEFAPEGQGEKRHVGDVAAARYSPSGECVVSTGDTDGRVLLWDVNTGKCFGELPQNAGLRTLVARYSADGRKLFTFGPTAKVYESSAWKPLHELVRDLQARELEPLTTEELGR